MVGHKGIVSQDFLPLFFHKLKQSSSLIHKLKSIWIGINICQNSCLFGPFVLLAIAPNWLLRYGPLHIICLSIISHGAGSGSMLWATARILVLRHRPQHGSQLQIKYQLDSICIHWLSIHMHVVVFLHTRGHVSMRSCTTCIWLCIHKQNLIFALWARAQNLVVCDGSQHRIWIFVIGHSSELYLL